LSTHDVEESFELCLQSTCNCKTEHQQNYKDNVSPSQNGLLKTSSKTKFKTNDITLHKFTSNSKEIIQTIAVEDRAKVIKKLDLNQETLPQNAYLELNGVSKATPSDPD